VTTRGCSGASSSFKDTKAFQVALVLKNLPANAGDLDLGSIPGLEDPLEEAIHFSILAWRIPWTEKPGKLQFKASDMTETI